MIVSSVVSARGNQVGVVREGRLAAGSHNETFDARRLERGAYFVVLECEGARQARGLVVE